jgi:hypothetical protein
MSYIQPKVGYVILSKTHFQSVITGELHFSFFFALVFRDEKGLLSKGL